MRHIAVLVTFAIVLLSAPLCRADHVLFLGDIVNRSSVTVAQMNDGGKLELQLTWGSGLGARTLKLKYNEAFDLQAATQGLKSLLNLLRDQKQVEFADAELSTKNGLTAVKQ